MTDMADEERSIRRRLADNVRRLRKERGWSQEHLADLSQLHRNQISAIERQTLGTGLDVLEKLARTFGISASELLE